MTARRNALFEELRRIFPARIAYRLTIAIIK